MHKQNQTQWYLISTQTSYSTNHFNELLNDSIIKNRQTKNIFANTDQLRQSRECPASS